MSAPLPCVVTMLHATEPVNDDWPNAVHETGHALAALLTGCRVEGVTLRSDHPDCAGQTWTWHGPWHGTLIARAGWVFEQIVLEPEVFAARAARRILPWSTDFVKAEERALLHYGRCDNMRDARRLAPRPGQEVALEEALDAQDERFHAEAMAIYEAREKEQMPRRRARVPGLIARADQRLFRTLPQHVVTGRVIADRLSKVHTLGAAELLGLFATGKAAQAEDDRRMKARR